MALRRLEARPEEKHEHQEHRDRDKHALESCSPPHDPIRSQYLKLSQYADSRSKYADDHANETRPECVVTYGEYFSLGKTTVVSKPFAALQDDADDGRQQDPAVQKQVARSDYDLSRAGGHHISHIRRLLERATVVHIQYKPDRKHDEPDLVDAIRLGLDALVLRAAQC